MTTATPEYLLNVVDEETYCKICEAMQGFRIYFPTIKPKANNIIKDYEQMKKAKYTRKNIIENLVCKYELTRRSIRRYIQDYESNN